MTIIVKNAVATFKARRERIEHLQQADTAEARRVIAEQQRLIDTIANDTQAELAALGLESLAFMEEHLSTDETAPEVAPAEETTKRKPGRPAGSKNAPAEPKVAPAPPEVVVVALAVNPTGGDPASLVVLAPVATPVVPAGDNPSGQVAFVGEGPVVGEASITPSRRSHLGETTSREVAEAAITEITAPQEARTYEQWVKAMPTFTKSQGVVNLLRSVPLAEVAVIRRAEMAGQKRESIIRLIDAHIADEASKAKAAAAGAGLGDDGPPF